MIVAELEGAQLDFWVAKTAGLRPILTGAVIPVCRLEIAPSIPFSPSKEWSLAGPIIERERIDVTYHALSDGGRWEAGMHKWSKAPGFTMTAIAGGSGPTPLIAAMRCFVASKFGDEVEQS